MTGLKPSFASGRAVPRIALALAASAVLGLTLADAGRAQTAQDSVAASAVAIPATTAVSGPTFQPSAEALAEQAALALPQPIEPLAEAPSAPAATPLGTPLGSGIASFYADRFNGQRTASGERFDNRALTAAHRTLPFGSLVRVTNPANGASVVVRITDRGPFSHGRLIDVSRAAAEELGLVRAGHGRVELELLEG
ncbi:septal ring lytic transglycosylase RlpA family protein [Alteraurantiacibacter palmitatis]|uniref:Endolytic peptidoglycan transglycosylase RlpA n=1 Tax=Alteraurantiacibacter palmitatis TaxID=2054628 RepID=A0ABV7E6C1_9SPHN